jgi:diguanylate cyclase (GGDEF)-like protein/PAS domain S-box-containing protein
MKKISTGIITFKYTVALGLLAILAVISYITLQKNIKSHKTSAAVINISGRQRMLSQRIALKTLQLITSTDISEKKKLRRDLSNAVNLMQASHNALIKGNKSMDIPGNPSPEVREMFFSLPLNLDARIRDYINSANILMHTPDAELVHENPAVEIILEKSNEVLISLDAIVRQFQEESENAVLGLGIIALMLLISVMSLLLLLQLFIFRPVVKRIKQESTELERAEEYSLTIMERAADGIIIIDDKGVIELFNTAAEDIFGYPSSQVKGRNVSMLMPEKYADRHDEYMKNYPSKTIKDKSNIFNREFEGLRKNGSTVPLSVSVSEINIQGRRLFIGNLRDITKRKKLEEQLQKTAITDELTGLLNRRGFFTLSEQHCKLVQRNRRMMSVLYIDLDNMKDINDDWGHHEGDVALVDTAEILKKSFRDSDIIARIGGDEFAVLLTEHTETDIENVIKNNVMSNLNAHNANGNRNHTLSLSMGFAHFDPDSMSSIDDVVAEADRMMYRVKKNKADS